MNWSCVTLLLAVTANMGARLSVAETVYVGDPNPKATTTIDKIDHGAWDALLKKYVDADGLVDYRSWKASAEDIAQLDVYLAHLSSGNPQANASRENRLAFWINAYNALTVYGMLREYPTTSIKNHTAKFFGYNIWKDLHLRLGGTSRSLDDIEHETLRKMEEPRIHFAVVCASISCPRLLNEAYVGDRLDEQLETNALDFFSRKGNFQLQGNRIRLSSILKWYGGDFGDDQASQLKVLSKWLPDSKAKQAARSANVRVSYLSYDWGINEQSRTPEKRQ